MQRASYPQGKWNAVFFLITLLVVAADQLSKTWIQSYPEGYCIFEAGLLRIIHIHNTGAAFGIFQGQSFALTIVDLIGIVVILLYALIGYHRLSPGAGRLGKSALGLVLGGTIGNVIDRLRFGYVTDFIYVSFWPAFNIADSAITVGAIIFACSLLLMTRTQKRPAG